MPRTVDDRVVEMQFDNSNFEQNVHTSIRTLDGLKSALSFKGTDKDFSIVENASATLTKSFSWLEETAKGVFFRLGGNIEQWAERTVKSLSGVNNAIAGFGKFGEITKATGTLKGQGYALKEIEEQIDRLNWFTDETSYNLTEMISNISKFTASGQGLEESADAMMGIALWAATAGQDANTASRAMYQLSQALSAGYMRLEDWKSIQNVSMDTRIFRQHVLDTAVALKTLKKNADGTYTSLMAEGKAGKEAFNIDQFTTHLTDGAWFTKDVMMDVYREYAGGVDAIYKYTEEHGVSAAEAVKALRGEVSDFALDAFLAGQQARTWEDAVEATKDAASTAWKHIFDDLFGQYDEVVEFFTELSIRFYDIFVEPINRIDNVLKGWGKRGGQAAFIQSIYNIVDGIENLSWVISRVFNKVVYGTTKSDVVLGIKVDTLTKVTGAVQKFTAGLADTFRNSFVFRRYLYVIPSLLGIAGQAIFGFYRAVKETFSGAGKVIGFFVEKVSLVAREIRYLMQRTRKNDTFYKFFSTALKPLKNLKEYLRDLYVAILPELTKRWGAFKKNLKERLSDPFSKLKDSLKGLGAAIKDAWSGLFSGRDVTVDASKLFSFWDRLKDSFHKLTGLKPGAFLDSVANGIDKLSGKIKGFTTWLTEADVETGLTGLEKIQNKFADVVEWIRSNLGAAWHAVVDAFSAAFDWISSNWDTIWNTAKKVGSVVWSFLSGLWESISGIFSKKDAKKTGESAFSGLLGSVKKAGSTLGKILSGIFSLIAPIVENLVNTLAELDLKNAGEFLKGGGIALLGAGFLEWARNFKKSNWLAGFGEILEGIGGVFDSFSHMLDAKALKEAAVAIAILVGALFLLVSLPQDNMMSSVMTLGMIIDIMANAMRRMSGLNNETKITKSGFAFSKSGAGTPLLMLALGMLAIAGALRMIADIDANSLYQATFVIGILMSIITSTVKKLMGSENKSLTKLNDDGLSKKFVKPGGVLLAIALSMVAIAYALQILADIASKEGGLKALGIAAAVVGALMAVIGFVIKSIQSIEVNKSRGLSKLGIGSTLFALAAFLGVAIYAIKTISDMIVASGADKEKIGATGMPKSMEIALAVIAGIMLALGIFLKTVSKTYKQTPGGKALEAVANKGFWLDILSLAASVYILALAFKAIATTGASKNDMLGAGALILLIMGVMVGFVAVANKADPKKIAVASASMLMFSAAIAIVAGVFAIIAGISHFLSKKALIATGVAIALIGSIFLVFVGLFGRKNMKKIDPLMMKKAAEALVVLSGALVIAAAAMVILSQIPEEKVGGVILMFAGLVAAIAILGKLASGSIGDGLLKLTTAFTLVAGAFALLAVALLAVVEAIRLFSDESLNVDAAADNIMKVLDRLPELVGKLLESLRDTILAIIPGLASGAIESITETLIALAKIDPLTGKSRLEALIEAVLVVIFQICDEIEKHATEIVEHLGGAILAILNGIGTWLSTHGEEVADALGTAIEGIMTVIVSLFDPLGKEIWGNAWDGPNGVKTKIISEGKTFLGVTVVAFLASFAMRAVSALTPLASFVGNLLGMIGRLIAAHPVLAGIVGAIGLGTYAYGKIKESYEKDKPADALFDFVYKNKFGGNNVKNGIDEYQKIEKARAWMQSDEAKAILARSGQNLDPSLLYIGADGSVKYGKIPGSGQSSTTNWWKKYGKTWSDAKNYVRQAANATPIDWSSYYANKRNEANATYNYGDTVNIEINNAPGKSAKEQYRDAQTAAAIILAQ